MAVSDYSLLAGLAVAALFAGLIDAVVGGGGLIQIPALFNALPQEMPATGVDVHDVLRVRAHAAPPERLISAARFTAARMRG